MKRNILSLSILTIISTYSFADYVIVLDKKNNDYKVGGFTTTTNTTDWTDYQEPFNCQNHDILESEIYFGKTATQTSECTQKQTATKTTTKVFEDGTENITTEVLYQDIDKTIQKEITGTHLEENCKNIMSNNYSVGDDIYTLYNSNGNFEAYCNMTVDGGGWTLLISETNGRNAWDQFSLNPIGTPLTDDYRGSLNIKDFLYTEIMWYNHPTNEYSLFTHRTNTELTLSGSPTTENNTYVYYASGGQRRSTNAYYNLIQCTYWEDQAKPVLMLSGSDQYGSDNGGTTVGKSCGSWESDTSSWYYRFAGGLTSYYTGNPWKSNGHSPQNSRLQSFYIR